MSSERVFQVALLVSLAVHGTILFQRLNLLPTLNQEKDKLKKEIEISYLEEKEEPKLKNKNEDSRKENVSRPPLKIETKKITPPPFIDKENVFNSKSNSSLGEYFTKPSLIKPDIIAIKKKITLPAVDLDKIDNPSYLNYYQIVREKIKRAAYQNYMRTETGEVYLTFTISNPGYLGQVRIIEEKSSGSSYLNSVALKSIKDASPFPTFPKELDYPELSFNVVISFEIE
jgi:TonB family protein